MGLLVSVSVVERSAVLFGEFSNYLSLPIKALICLQAPEPEVDCYMVIGNPLWRASLALFLASQGFELSSYSRPYSGLLCVLANVVLLDVWLHDVFSESFDANKLCLHISLRKSCCHEIEPNPDQRVGDLERKLIE